MKFLQMIAIIMAVFAASASASAQTLGQEKTILPLIKNNWIAFRNYDGRQLLYFTTLISYKCGLKEIRFSLEDDGLGEYFPLPACDPQRPNAIGDEPIYLTMPLGTATWAKVQIVYKDGTESEIVKYGVCDNPGDSTCVVVLP